mmetsp:Transcript_31307/g.88764  ORF Transcript_31307/g.88764 Transcript_31307/m.88764 type:complete len:508 (-) Transcript_31307:314-1837(-)
MVEIQAQESGAEEGRGSQDVVFMATLPALGWKRFVIRPVAGDHPNRAAISTVRNAATEPTLSTVSVTNGQISVSLAPASGRLVSVDNLRSNVSTTLQHGFLWYRSSGGQEEEYPGRASGAYIFRAAGDGPGIITDISASAAVEWEVLEGPVVKEVRQNHGEWASVAIRLWEGKAYLDTDWMVGPIPLEDNLGKEVVSRWTSGLNSGATFFTDANGRQLMRRTYNKDAGAAASFRPITSAATVSDSAGQEFMLITERGQAAASMAPGQLEVLVHRRPMADDGRGAGEPLNETTCNCHDCTCPPSSPGLIAMGRHVIGVEEAGCAARVRRMLQEELNSVPLVLFSTNAPESKTGDISSPDSLDSLAGEGTMLASSHAALPPNIHLTTLMEDLDHRLILRLAHGHEANNTTALGAPTCVNVEDLLGPVSRLKELTLTGVDVDQPGQPGGGSGSSGGGWAPLPAAARFSCQSGAPWSVKVFPLEIVTVKVELAPSTSGREVSRRGDRRALW